MDLGLYNKHSAARGEHGTLIGNWVEERALKQQTGHARFEDLTLEKRAANLTTDRIVSHSANLDSRPADRISTTAATFVPHPTSAFQPKIFNQTGSHWHHDEVGEGRQGRRRDMESSISFGEYKAPLSSTQASSFLHPTHVLPADMTPLKLQTLQRGQGQSFPNTNATSGGVLKTKLMRPYADDEQ